MRKPKRDQCDYPGCKKKAVGGFYCLGHYPKAPRDVKVPINKRFEGRHCARVKFWRVKDGKPTGTIEVETALSEDMADFLLYLFCNESRLTDELLDKVLVEIRQKRSDHEMHHP